MNKIYIHRGDCTIWANQDKFLTFHIGTNLDLTGYKAEFVLCSIKKPIDNISDNTFEVILSGKETSKLWIGEPYGELKLIDTKGHVKTITNKIPFCVTNDIIQNEAQIIDLDVLESSEIDLTLRVAGNTGSGGTTDYRDLDYKPSINNIELVGNKTLDELGIQPTGDYALSSDIPSLDEYVKNTDYPTHDVAGVVKIYAPYGITTSSVGCLQINSATESIITEKTDTKRPITPSTLDYAVKVGVTTNTLELTEEEKASAKQWLGYADNADIMQAIASIPQFKLAIVDALPDIGAKMVLYLVPKEGSGNDVYNEYIWIDDTLSFEFIGTTAVDLTDYALKSEIPNISNLVTLNTNQTITGSKLFENGIKVGGYAGVRDNNDEPFIYVDTTHNGWTIGSNNSGGWFGDIHIKRGKSGNYINIDSGNIADYVPKLQSITQTDYDALTSKDANTLYLIEEE